MVTQHSAATAATRERQKAYWRSTRKLTWGLFAVWFIVTISVIFFARELSGFTILGWPFSFYMAAQGSTLIYVLIIAVYAWRMRHLDNRREGRGADGQ